MGKMCTCGWSNGYFPGFSVAKCAARLTNWSNALHLTNCATFGKLRAHLAKCVRIWSILPTVTKCELNSSNARAFGHKCARIWPIALRIWSILPTVTKYERNSSNVSRLEQGTFQGWVVFKFRCERTFNDVGSWLRR